MWKEIKSSGILFLNLIKDLYWFDFLAWFHYALHFSYGAVRNDLFLWHIFWAVGWPITYGGASGLTSGVLGEEIWVRFRGCDSFDCGAFPWREWAFAEKFLPIYYLYSITYWHHYDVMAMKFYRVLPSFIDIQRGWKDLLV